MSQTAGRSRGSSRVQRLSTSSSTSSHSTTSSTIPLGRSRSSTSPATTKKVPLSPTTISATAFKSSFNSVPPVVNIVVSPHANLKSFQTEFSSQHLVNGNNNNNSNSATNSIINSNSVNNKTIDVSYAANANVKAINSKKSSAAVSSTSSSTTSSSKSKKTKMSAAAVDVRSVSHSPSPMIESNNNLVDRKTGLPYHHKNIAGMKGTAGSGSNAHVNGTSTSHVHVYKESSISLKPTTGLQDQVPQQSSSPQMYSVSLAFKTPKLHYSNQLYIYPYYVVTFCESAQTKLEADVAPSLEKQIKYCNVFYFDFNAQPQQPPPPPEEEEEEEEEWTEFYEEVHHTTVITETKTEAANAYHMQQHAAAQQSPADQEVMYTDNLALAGSNLNAGGGVGAGGGGGGSPLGIANGGITNGSSAHGSHPPPPHPPAPGSDGSSRGPASSYSGPSLSDVISLDESPPGRKSSSKRQSKGGRQK